MAQQHTKKKQAAESAPSAENTIPVSSSGFPRRYRVLFRFVLGLVFVTGAALGFREITSPDIGFHLGTARWMIENAAFPKTDLFTYTVPNHPYIDLQWLFQMMLYGMYRLGDAAFVTVFTIAATLLFGALLLIRTKRNCGHLPLSVIPLLVLFFLGNQWEPRPHLLSWIFGSLVLLILEEYDRGSRRRLPFLPLIMLLWVNTHSLFVLGPVMIGIYLLWSLYRQPGHVDKKLIIWSAAAGLACLLNPYHIKGLLFPLIQLHDLQGAAGFKSPVTGIAEFTSPFGLNAYFTEGRFVLFQPRFFWQVFTLLAVIALAGNRKKGRLPEWILFICFFYVFWRANKNFGYFVMASFPFIAGGLDELAARIRRKRLRQKTLMKEFRVPAKTLAGYGALSLILIVLTLSGRMYDLAWSPQRIGIGFSRAALPVNACEFLNRHHITGRILNSWNQGGYIAWATGQNVFIYSHGEVTGPDFYNEYIQAKQPRGLSAALRKWRPTVAVVPFETAPYWLYYFDRSRDWRMVYADSSTAIFLQASAGPGIPALPRPEAGSDYPFYDEAAARRLIEQAAKADPPGFWKWLEGSRAYPVREIKRSSFYLQTAQPDACIGVSLAGLQKTDFSVPDLMLNLGYAENARRRYDLSDLCFNAFLRVDKDPVIAQEIKTTRLSRRHR